MFFIKSLLCLKMVVISMTKFVIEFRKLISELRKIIRDIAIVTVWIFPGVIDTQGLYEHQNIEPLYISTKHLS